MKSLFPPYSRVLGYIIMTVALFLPFVMFLLGRVTDTNLLLYRECSKLLVMVGSLMVIFASSKEEGDETEHIRIAAVRNAMFITVFLVFGLMLYRVYIGDFQLMNSSSFVIFLIIVILCLEFGLNKSRIDKMFKR